MPRGLPHHALAALCAPLAVIAFIALASPSRAANPSHADSPSAQVPRPAISATFAEPAVLRADRQLPAGVAVTFAGVDARSKVTVDWGDGTPYAATRGRCAVTGASAFPAACAVTLAHEYARPGAFLARAWARGVRQQVTYTIVAPPVRWKPPADEPAHPQWAHYPGRGAVFTPCESIPWLYDSSGQPADRSNMKADVEAALAMISAETGLRFFETADPAAAKLVYDWLDLSEAGADVAGYGGFRGNSNGFVTFSSTNAWTADAWSGATKVRREWDAADGWRWWEEKQGRTWLAVHETLHALGIAHVEDSGQIMNPTITRSQWGEGDLAALHTMYKDLGCPVIPD